MEIVNLTKDKYKEWDDFCLESDDAWFWHTTKWLEYTLNFQLDSHSESKSFFILKDNKIAAICPLILEERSGVKEFSYNKSYGIIPAFANHLTRKERDKLMKLMFERLDYLAEENNVKRISMRFVILNPSFIETQKQKYNYLKKFGYLDNSLNTRIIDLRRPLDELRKKIRHGHDSDIDRASKILKSEIFDYSNITKEAFNGYLELHHKDKGRLKRKEITFDMMYDWIKEKNAFLIGTKKEGKFVGFSYFFLFKNNVYYGSACNDKDCSNMPIAHFIQWQAIKWMHKKNIKFYEIGWQHFADTFSNFPSEKDISIARFKRGFGGFTVPLFMGEKYYNKDYFLEIYNSRIKKYSDNFNMRKK